MGPKVKIKLPVLAWGCTSCGNADDIPGLVRECPTCGSSRSESEGEKFRRARKKVFLTDPGLIRRYLNLDSSIELRFIDARRFGMYRNDIELDVDEIKGILLSASDRMCSYCGSDNEVGESKCVECGASLQSAARRIAKAGPVKRVTESRRLKRVIRSAPVQRVASSRSVQAMRKRTEVVAINNGVPTSYIVVPALLLLLMLVGYLFWYFVLDTEEFSGRVQEQKWVTSVTVSEYVKNTGKGYSVPAGAKITNQDEITTTCPAVGDTTTVEALELGNGLAAELEVDTSDDTPACVPTTSTFYHYTYMEWESGFPKSESGNDFQPVWPRVTALNWNSGLDEPCLRALRTDVAELEGATKVTSCSVSYSVTIVSGDETYNYTARDKADWLRVIELERVDFEGNRLGHATNVK